MANKKTENTTTSPAKSGGDGVMWAVLSYIFILWIVPLWINKPRDDYAVFHAKQAFGLFLVWVVLGVVMMVPILGWIIGFFGYLLLVVLWLMGIIYAATGKKQPLPVLGTKFQEWFATL